MPSDCAICGMDQQIGPCEHGEKPLPVGRGHLEPIDISLRTTTTLFLEILEFLHGMKSEVASLDGRVRALEAHGEPMQNEAFGGEHDD